MELLGYSFGKKHDLRERPPTITLRDLLSRFQQAPVIRAADTDQDALLLWVRIPHRSERFLGDDGSYIAAAKGVNGYVYPSSSVNPVETKYRVGFPYGTNGGPTGMTSEDIMAIPVTCYPQREGRFEVELTQLGDRKPFTTFQITNPNPARPAPFPAEPLPATRQEQDLKVTFEGVTPASRREYVLPDGSTRWFSSNEVPQDAVLKFGEEGRRQITLTYAFHGQPDPNWKISELKAFDAMGNRTDEAAAAPLWPCRNYWPPSAGEPHKLRVGVHKTWQNRFDADELWTVRDIPIPTQGKPVPITGEFRRDDLHLQLVSVYGMDGKNFSSDLAIVRIKIESPALNPVLLLHVEDEQGHTILSPWGWMSSIFPPGCTEVEIGNLTQAHTGTIGDNDHSYRTVPLKIPKGVHHLKLFFKLPRTHFFEFTAPSYSHVSE